MFQALLFDFDGLILDTETSEVQFWQELFSRHGQEFPYDEWVRTVVGAAVAILDPVTRLEQLTGQALDRQTLHEQAHRSRLETQARLPPLPGVVDAIDTAQLLGLRLAIASSSPHAWVDGYLGKLGLYERFEAITCREDAARLKPAPDLFLAAMTALHVRADQALAFEDSPNGIQAAKAAGLRVVGVPNPITARLGPLPADLVLSSLSELSMPEILSYFGDRLDLQPETAKNLPGIRAVEETAFRRPDEADLVDLARLRNQIILSMVAEMDGRVVGHVLFTPVTVNTQAGGERFLKGLGLGPLAVRPEAQHTGIGSRLVRAGLEHVRRAGYGFVVLLGDPGYYSRFGFRPGKAFNFSSDYGDGDEFQVLELQPGRLTGACGRVKYIPEFSETTG